MSVWAAELGRFGRVLRRELLVAGRRRIWVAPLAGFAALAALLPLALRGQVEVLGAGGAAQLCCCCLLAMLLQTEALFAEEQAPGGLLAILARAAPADLRGLAACAARCGAWWLAAGLPLSGAAALAALAYGMAPAAALAALAVFPVLTLALAFLGGFASALALGRGGLLVALLALPLAIPSLLLATDCLVLAQRGASPAEPLALLAATALFQAAVLPLASCIVLRAHLE